MKPREILEILRSTGIPVTYFQWPMDDPANPVPALPYMVYYIPTTRTEPADDHIWQKIGSLRVELYSSEKDFDLEELVESILDQHFLWQKEEIYLSSEHMYEVLYIMEVTLDG